MLSWKTMDITISFSPWRYRDFEFEYEYKIEHENSFPILVFRFHIITTPTHLIPSDELPSLPKTMTKN